LTEKDENTALPMRGAVLHLCATGLMLYDKWNDADFAEEMAEFWGDYQYHRNNCPNCYIEWEEE